LRAFGRGSSPASPSTRSRLRQLHRLAVEILCCAQKSTISASLAAYSATSARFSSGV
jgi:hypothetical protein